jgi:hypothetical protein
MKTVKIKVWFVEGHYDTYGPFLTKAEADDKNTSFGSQRTYLLNLGLPEVRQHLFDVVEGTREAILA